MYNAQKPSPDELPSTAQLIRSTLIALLAAVVLLVTVVLPAEYAIDPTGIGRMLNLTEMGEIKQQLAAEAEEDRLRDEELRRQQEGTEPERRSGLDSMLAGLFISIAHAHGPGGEHGHGGAMMAEPAAADPNAGGQRDETVFTLQPAEGLEWKMQMTEGAEVRYSWTAEGGVVNYDMHGTPAAGGKETSYKAARGVPGDQGVLTAGYDGKHGWFWRNRGKAPVTITLVTEGDYSDLKQMK